MNRYDRRSRKMKRVFLMVVVLTVMSAVSAFAWSYSEDFDSVPAGSSITACGWVPSTPGTDMQVATGLHPDWTGNYAYCKTSTSYASFYEVLTGAPTTGLLHFSCKAFAPNPYEGVNYYYGAGAVGLGDAAGNNLCNWGPAADNRDMWFFDARGMEAGYAIIVQPGIKDIYDNKLSVRLDIYVDQTAKQVWGVVQGTTGPWETPHLAYNPAYTVGSVRIYESNESWKDQGPDIDDITVTGVPEPASLLALASGLMGIAGMTIRRRR
jgi:hypothetical protein